MKRARWKLVTVVVVALACLALALHGTDPDPLLAAWRAFAPWRVPAVMAAYVMALLARTERFRRLVRTPIPYRAMLPLMAASFLAINALPLRTGELVRPYLLAQRGVPYTESLWAVLVERLLDVAALLVLVLVASVWLGGTAMGGTSVHVAGSDVEVLGPTMLALVLALGVGSIVAVALGARYARPGGRAALLAARAGDALGALARSSASDRVVIAATTIGSWLASLLACGLCMGGFDALEADLRAVVVDWAATMTAVVAVPTPGSIGGFEVGTVAGLVLLDRDADTARAFALALHATQLGTTLVTGLAGFAALGASLPAVVRASRSV